MLFAARSTSELPLESWKWRYADHPLGTRPDQRGDRSGEGGSSVTMADTRRRWSTAARQARPGPGLGAGPDAITTLIAHQNGDVMTDPAARRLGHGGVALVRRLAQHFWARLPAKAAPTFITVQHQYRAGAAVARRAWRARARTGQPAGWRIICSPPRPRAHAPHRRACAPSASRVSARHGTPSRRGPGVPTACSPAVTPRRGTGATPRGLAATMRS